MTARLHVAWESDGSVHLPATIVGHLHDGVADYWIDGDLGALAGLFVTVAELFDDIDCDEGDVTRRIVGGVQARAAARLQADADLADRWVRGVLAERAEQRRAG